MGSSPATTTISPCLWFDGDAEDAARFYAGVFPDSRICHVSRHPDGRALMVDFTLAGRGFQGLNGGPEHAGFGEAVSFSISCADQDEVDYYWDTLVAGGEESMCGWLRDRFGLSWQVVPQQLIELLGDPEPARAGAAMEALMSMRRIVVADLRAAADAASGTRRPAPVDRRG